MLAVGAAVLVGLAAWCGVRIRGEYETRRHLTLTTVALVWVMYSLHFGLVAVAATHSIWPLSLPAWCAAAGGLLVVGGTGIYLAAAVEFRSLKRMSGMDASRLVTTGIYRWSRNPQNVGWTLFLVGVGILRFSGMALLLAALFWIGFRVYLPLEERLLERLYGDAFREYRARTHRYIGHG